MKITAACADAEEENIKGANSDFGSDGDDNVNNNQNQHSLSSDDYIRKNTDRSDNKSDMKSDKLADLMVNDNKQCEQLPVKVLAANLQQFYNTKTGSPVKGKPPQVPRKPVVKGFVTKVDIASTKGLSKEDAEAVAVLDHSIAMSERRMNNPESDNLIEEILIPAARTQLQQMNIKSSEEDVLAQRSHELAKFEINGILDCSPPPPFIDDDYMEPRACSSSSTDSGVPECREPLLVAAIDVGTAYSGYAFSFTKDPYDIKVMKKLEAFWIHKHKQPTCILLKPSGQFYSFGFNAQMNYHDLELSDDKQNWMYFDKFKMALHTTKTLSLATEIKAVNGKGMKAISVFTHVLQYFKGLVLEELTDSTGTKISNDDVRWVITVPAIWRQPAKQFMRTAAYQAGLASRDNPNQLLIALEPEAASLYCRRLKMDQLICDDDDGSKSLHISDDKSTNEQNRKTMDSVLAQGTRYMVVDCGGGTVDITVYEVENSSGHLRELHKASGGPYGSVGVDRQFEILLEKIFGQEFIASYKKEVPEGYVYLMLKFESRKLCATTHMTKPLNIELPYTFILFYMKYVKDMSGVGALQKAVEESGVEGVTFSSTGMLRMNPGAMLQLFEPTVASIKEHVSQVLLQPRVIGIKYLFLVGGFAESQILQAEIRQEFSKNFTVIIPRDVSVSILQGAVMFGLDPSVVCVRCSRMTYGVGVLNYFDPESHPKEKLISKNGINWCTDVFDKFVGSNQSVGLGETVCRSYTPASPDQKFLVLHVYMSEEEDPRFITDPGVLRCGTLALDLRDSNKIASNGPEREIQAIMTFGDTEIKASAVDMTTKKCVAADIDFLT